MQNQTAELFCGTKSFSRVARGLGYRTWTCDLDPAHDPDVLADMLSIDTTALPANVDILWASPPCEGFSVAAIGKNWNRDYTPKHPRAVVAQALVRKTADLIRATRPRWWFIENPRGMLRKLRWFDDVVHEMGGVRKTVTYCKYGDSRMKPTDIWSNATWWRPREKCSSGDCCHVAAPRGSKTGTQGIKGAVDRARIPSALFAEIFHQMPQTHLIAAV
jgi:C-5 cytosine-specific DNA methylase